MGIDINVPIELYIQLLQRYAPGFGWFGINLFLILKVFLCFTICDNAFGLEGWRPAHGGDHDTYGKNNYFGKFSKYTGGLNSGTECDTKTPGCELGCINDLWPIGMYFS